LFVTTISTLTNGTRSGSKKVAAGSSFNSSAISHPTLIAITNNAAVAASELRLIQGCEGRLALIFAHPILR
jgi:hypothetical protein